ncbi:formyltransferase family protein [Alcaligenes sp. SDU_A2]|uniref:formyltransferase family protein n=1 Tax=Alcaligenes sp. SDU_A2 TaxID=3136634 RepID=UPI00311D7D45
MKRKLVYVMSLRNAAADKAGQWVAYKGERRYMMSPLEYLVHQLNDSELGNLYSLEALIYDDIADYAADQAKLGSYGRAGRDGSPWIYPLDLCVQGRPVNELLENIPSTYRSLPVGDPARSSGKQAFEQRLQQRFQALEADWVVLDGLIVILDELVRPGAPFQGRIVNIHPGLTRQDSPYRRRGATATLDALYGARGQQILNWQTMATRAVTPLNKTGASFHVVDQGIDSGPVLWEVLNTQIEPDDTILELRWKNFTHSLFPALSHGLAYLASQPQGS